MRILGLEELPWDLMRENKRRVFLRVDFNVPIESGKVVDDFRIRQSIPTIKALMERNCIVVIGAHLGRPKKLPPEKRSQLSLLPVAEKLAELMDHEVLFSEEIYGSGVRKLVMDARPGKTLIMLENLRFHEAEEENDPDFAEKLFQDRDIYINDAFGVSHRAHASVEAIAQRARVKAAGLLLQKEYKTLDSVLNSAIKPQMAILGGAKIEDKIRVIERLMESCQHIFIGGRMGLSFLAAKAYSLGQTQIEKEAVQMAKRLIADAKAKGVEIHYPLDAKVAGRIDAAEAKEVLVENIPSDQAVFDIGSETLKNWSQVLSKAKSVIWNGPMGVFENPVFSGGTLSIVDLLVSMPEVRSVVGGGETVAAVTQRGALDKLYHVSTGGGAMLEYMEGRDLPGLEVLKLRDREIAELRDLIENERRSAVI